MAEETAIEWAHSTYNPWWGCTKVSEACRSCYAESWANRWGNDIWGDDKPRRFFGDKHWNEPLKWNRQAAKSGESWRVFCGSMCDVCEDREDLLEPRARLMRLIEATPALTWMLLTKRPENFNRLFGRRWNAGGWPKNVWAMTTVENQEQAEKRIPHLLKVRAAVLGLSMEPLLGRVNLRNIESEYANINALSGLRWDHGNDEGTETGRISWIIDGGESGAGARPTHPDWFMNLRDQCNGAGIPYLHKQNGEWIPVDKPWEQNSPASLAKNERWMNLAGGHGFHGESVYRMRRVGKKAAGRILDGRTHDGYPQEALCLEK